MNISAKILMAALVSLSILIFWNNQRIMAALVAGFLIFIALEWKGHK